ncbi:MAG: cobalamin-dependent protein [Cloacibacillus porcorum]|uniref:cobalamin-dependent protein n=1 Tax=Cloacibacillus porcorum TaxID=1197717 RepID=UPI0023F2AD6F|nr:cobalamin-dependent protein [Cloacibacillus porcorum]MCD7877605.1 cobalamin-dependent protein [Cloacibacillus porcorum]
MMFEIKFNKRFDWKELPPISEIEADASRLAKGITVGETLFFREHGVKSDAEYKRRAIAEGLISKHSHVGWNSWEETAKNIEFIYSELKRRGSYITRFGFILDWVMGVPAAYRDKLPKGTGLILNTPEEWAALGQIVPVQPHMSDHMIGSPNELENTVFALNAGVTSIGNVSHYFTYEYPGVELEYERTVNSLTAFMLMGKVEGTIVHSNMDDGFGNQFRDLASITGWAMMERYLVEDMLGARMAFAYGNLFSDPMGRIIILSVMEKLNKHHTPGTMIFGNTVDYGLDYQRNYGALASFSLADAIFQRHTPTGHAVASVPVTEAVRIPTAQEIVDGQLTVDMMIEKSKFMAPFINWERVNAERDLYIICGKIFFERMMNALDDLGVDINHPGEICAALKAIGPRQLEDNFGAGEKTTSGERLPVRPTDMIKNLNSKKDQALARFGEIEAELSGEKVLVGSTDIHDYGKEIVKAILTKAGATVFDLGNYVTPEEVVDTLIETEAKAVALSTYNGIALSYAKELTEKMRESGTEATLILGGQLNENMEGGSLAVDVTEELRALGVNCDNDMDKILSVVKSIYAA